MPAWLLFVPAFDLHSTCEVLSFLAPRACIHKFSSLESSIPEEWLLSSWFTVFTASDDKRRLSYFLFLYIHQLGSREFSPRPLRDRLALGRNIKTFLYHNQSYLATFTKYSQENLPSLHSLWRPSRFRVRISHISISRLIDYRFARAGQGNYGNYSRSQGAHCYDWWDNLYGEIVQRSHTCSKFCRPMHGSTTRIQRCL